MVEIAKERSRNMAAKMDNLRGMLGIRRIYEIHNARVKEKDVG